MYEGAEVPLICVIPEYEGGDCTLGREQPGNRAFLERKSQSIPSTFAVGWRGSFCPVVKIDHCQLNV